MTFIWENYRVERTEAVETVIKEIFPEEEI